MNSIIYKNYVHKDCDTGLETEIIHLGRHNLMFSYMKRIYLKRIGEGYVETWAIYFKIVDSKNAIHGKDIFNYYKIVVCFNSLYVPDNTIAKNISSDIAKEVTAPINNVDTLLIALEIRHCFTEE